MRDPWTSVRLPKLGSTLANRSESWRGLARCAGDTELMHDETKRGRAAAVAICTRCVVLEDCRTWALAGRDPVPYAVAGGLTPYERSKVRRAGGTAAAA